jgi:DNA-binding response OmpR family regulator
MAKVLVIDDSATQAALMAQLMFRHNHLVEIETSGQRGLAHALRQEFDLIISDLNLPDLTGLEVCRQYKASGGTALTLLVSSEDQLNRLPTVAGSDIDGYCTKDSALLEARVEIMLLRQRHKRLSKCG